MRDDTEAVFAWQDEPAEEIPEEIPKRGGAVVLALVAVLAVLNSLGANVFRRTPAVLVNRFAAQLMP